MGINLKCSTGWLQRFKERRNITWHSVSGGGASANLDSADKWRENVKPIVTQYAPNDIFNRDEMALFYNAQPERTLALKGQKCQGGKGYKDCVTFLLCCNAGGSEKFRPLIVGKFEKPCC
jgi:hypothetical protein